MCSVARALGRIRAGQGLEDLSYACLWSIWRVAEPDQVSDQLMAEVKAELDRRRSEYSLA